MKTYIWALAEFMLHLCEMIRAYGPRPTLCTSARHLYCNVDPIHPSFVYCPVSVPYRQGLSNDAHIDRFHVRLDALFPSVYSHQDTCCGIS